MKLIGCFDLRCALTQKYQIFITQHTNPSSPPNFPLDPLRVTREQSGGYWSIAIPCSKCKAAHIIMCMARTAKAVTMPPRFDSAALPLSWCIHLEAHVCLCILCQLCTHSKRGRFHCESDLTEPAEDTAYWSSRKKNPKTNWVRRQGEFSYMALWHHYTHKANVYDFTEVLSRETEAWNI